MEPTKAEIVAAIALLKSRLSHTRIQALAAHGFNLRSEYEKDLGLMLKRIAELEAKLD